MLPGDWTWKITPPGVTIPEATSTPTLLEINFVWPGPPASPLIAPNAVTPTQSDFQNHLNRSMGTIWQLGQVINPNTAASTTFIKTLFGIVNCYDLVGPAQLGMAIIQSSGGTEYFGSLWIFCGPFGYFLPGSLIGWMQYPNCNPFSIRGAPNLPQTDPTQLTARKLPLTYLRTEQKTFLNYESRVNVFLTELNPSVPLQHIGVTIIGVLPTLICEPAVLPVAVDPLAPKNINNRKYQMTKLRQQIHSSALQTVRLSQPYLESPNTRSPFHTEITNYEDPRGAANTFRQHSSSLVHVNLAHDFVGPSHLGDECIRIPYHILFRRNPLAVRVFTGAGMETNPKTLPQLMLDISNLLDDHINNHPLHHAGTKNIAPLPKRFETTSRWKLGNRVSIHIDQLDNSHGVRIPEVQDRDVLVPTHLGREDDNTFEFAATPKKGRDGCEDERSA
ncbi:hypothetical protein AJ80_02768 [Polytolypa hystricis UAMH7299]|uniref:Uncharacterized protein n=1 Tax=Polytolypa hystricis (strain UAMH7299) TaxID=1447883 RepID=A0A2B7YR84_POLH7|nr:hypothetical protein AJ80_02768 [Polytolypa hystricis UAMH7299]